MVAGVPVYLQVGEIGWWYFSDYDAATNADGGMGLLRRRDEGGGADGTRSGTAQLHPAD